MLCVQGAPGWIGNGNYYSSDNLKCEMEAMRVMGAAVGINYPALCFFDCRPRRLGILRSDPVGRAYRVSGDFEQRLGCSSRAIAASACCSYMGIWNVRCSVCI